MNEPKDNNSGANKIIGIIIGSISALAVFFAMRSGRVSLGRRSPRTFYVAQDPGVFWFVVGIYAAISNFMFWLAFKGGKK
jgi:hypothetical protein